MSISIQGSSCNYPCAYKGPTLASSLKALAVTIGTLFSKNVRAESTLPTFRSPNNQSCIQCAENQEFDNHSPEMLRLSRANLLIKQYFINKSITLYVDDFKNSVMSEETKHLPLYQKFQNFSTFMNQTLSTYNMSDLNESILTIEQKLTEMNEPFIKLHDPRESGKRVDLYKDQYNKFRVGKNILEDEGVTKDLDSIILEGGNILDYKVELDNLCQTKFFKLAQSIDDYETKEYLKILYKFIPSKVCYITVDVVKNQQPVFYPGAWKLSDHEVSDWGKIDHIRMPSGLFHCCKHYATSLFYHETGHFIRNLALMDVNKYYLEKELNELKEEEIFADSIVLENGSPAELRAFRNLFLISRHLEYRQVSRNSYTSDGMENDTTFCKKSEQEYITDPHPPHLERVKAIEKRLDELDEGYRWKDEDEQNQFFNYFAFSTNMNPISTLRSLEDFFRNAPEFSLCQRP